MGQAKIRGTLQQRVAQGKIAKEKKDQELLQMRLDKEANLTPEQRKARNKSAIMVAGLLAAIALIGK